MLQKLKNYGVRGIPHDWFINYLSNRKQFVSFNGLSSETMPVVCGIPQGSIIGPLLFLIYMNDIINTSELLHFVLYADDTNIFISHADKNTLQNYANVELNKISCWFKANKLFLNTDKTKYMFFCSNKRQQLQFDFSIKLDNLEIQRASSINFLGVQIDDKLTWVNHINSIRGKISMSIGMLSKLSYFLPLKTLFTLYNAIVLPYFDYCSLVWGGASSCHLNRLHTLQKKAIRLCSNSHYLAHTPPLFKKLNILNFSDNITIKTGVFMYRYSNFLLPPVFDNYFITVDKKHNVNTRQKNKIFLPYARLKLRKVNSIQQKGGKLWNNIDDSIKHVTTLSSFKSKFKLRLLTTYI